MAAGDCQRRYARPKSVAVADLDKWLRAYVWNEGGSTELEDIGDEIDLPCDFNTALELWTAWRDKHIMARAGGYLDQPRWWRDLMRFLSSRHAPLYEQYQAKDRPPQDNLDEDDGVEQGAPFDFTRLK